MTNAQIGRRALLRGAGGLAALAAVPSLAACDTGTSRVSSESGKGGGKTVVVRDSGGSYGAVPPRASFRGLHVPKRSPMTGTPHRVGSSPCSRPDPSPVARPPL